MPKTVARTTNKTDSRVTAPEPHLTRAVELVTELMAIPGKSGQERQVAEFIIDQLRRAGAPASAIQTDAAWRKTPIRGDVGNLIVKLPGKSNYRRKAGQPTTNGVSGRNSPRRLMMAHMDTVPICVGSKPEREGDMIRSADPQTGLGADDRAGAAAILCAALEILERDLPHPPLTFVWSIQEETGLQGVRNIRLGLLGKPKLAFNWDGGAASKMTVGATGGYRMEIEITGIASHAGGAPEWGVSAIAVAALAIAELHREGWHGAVSKGGRYGTTNVGMIRGGEATNVVTDHVTVWAEARSHDPKFRQKIVDRMEKAFQQAASQVKNAAGAAGRVEIKGRLDYESFRLAEKEPCVLLAERAIHSVGLKPVRAIANGGVDANWMTAHGIPTVTIGCGQIGQHTTYEALDVKDFEQACRIALRLATGTENAIETKKAP